MNRNVQENWYKLKEFIELFQSTGKVKEEDKLTSEIKKNVRFSGENRCR